MMHTNMRGARGRGAHSNSERLARGLGYFSIALGLAELLAPRAVSRSIGLEGREELVRVYGAREIATGVAILASHDPTPWIWGRLAGDAIDLVTLGTAVQDAGHEDRESLSLTAVAVLGVAALDAACVYGLTADKRLGGGRSADYSDRRGFPRNPAAMRGAAGNVRIPDDMRLPRALRPYGSARNASDPRRGFSA
jgi:hypothetical protein